MDSYTNLLEIVFKLDREALISLKAIIDCELRYRDKTKENIIDDKENI